MNNSVGGPQKQSGRFSSEKYISLAGNGTLDIVTRAIMKLHLQQMITHLDTRSSKECLRKLYVRLKLPHCIEFTSQDLFIPTLKTIGDSNVT
jgi:hypothetical protein